MATVKEVFDKIEDGRFVIVGNENSRYYIGTKEECRDEISGFFVLQVKDIQIKNKILNIIV